MDESTRDLIKAAEKKGYSRGYNAGRLKSNKEEVAERLRLERQRFIDSAFLAALPAVIATNWDMQGGKNTAETKVQAAWMFAKSAARQRP